MDAKAIASGKGVEEWLIERANQVETLSQLPQLM